MSGLCDIACKMVFSRHLNQNCSSHGCFHVRTNGSSGKSPTKKKHTHTPVVCSIF